MSYDPNTFFLEGTLCTAQHGPAAIYIALLDEGENQLINSYVVPRGPVIDWKTESTGLTSFTDILPYDPLPTEKVIESIREFITSESILVGHRVDEVIEALGLQLGKDYAESVDISRWFALKVTSTLIQQFPLAHIVKCIAGEEIYDLDSDERDPMVDAHWVRTIYLTYKGYPYDLPLLCQIRQHLYSELPKEKRDIDPIQTVSVSCIPHDWTIKEVKKSLPKKVVHLIERIEDIQFDPKTKFGTSIVIFKNADDVSELTLRLHSNPEEWIWTVKLEGQAYTHKVNGITINEMEPLEHKMYVHSIPDTWNELDVRSKLVPQELYPNLKEVRPMQFRDSKDGTRRLGRTHIVFTDSWCVNSMMQYLQGTYYEWSWKANTSTGKVTWKHGEDGTLVEPSVCITWEDLMGQGQL